MFTRTLRVRANWLICCGITVSLTLAGTHIASAQTVIEDDQAVEWVDESWVEQAGDDDEIEIIEIDSEIEDEDEYEKALASAKVQGSDDRDRVTNTTAFPWRAIGRILVEKETGGGTVHLVGTGVLIGRKTVLTCAHVLVSNQKWFKNVTFAPGKDDSDEPYGRIKVVKKRVMRAYYDNHDSDYDFALMVLAEPIGNTTGYMQMTYKESSYFDGSVGLNTAGYPGDLGGTHKLYRAYGKSLGNNGKIFHHNADTAGGQSGSPVWVYYPDQGKRKLVGVHIAGANGHNSAVRMSRTNFDWVNDYLKEHDTIHYTFPTASTGSTSGSNSNTTSGAGTNSNTGGSSGSNSNTGGTGMTSTGSTYNPFLPGSLGGTSNSTSACGSVGALAPMTFAVLAFSAVRPSRRRF